MRFRAGCDKDVTVIKLGVNTGSGDGGICFGVQVWTDTAKLTNIVRARFGDRERGGQKT